MTINIDPIERALGFIEAHPEQHEQKMWTCETGACLAGHIALMDGWQITRVDGKIQNGVVHKKDQLNCDVYSIACELTGLSSWEEAMRLFAATNDVDKLKAMTKDLANGEQLTERWVKVGEVDGYLPIFERVE